MRPPLSLLVSLSFLLLTDTLQVNQICSVNFYSLSHKTPLWVRSSTSDKCSYLPVMYLCGMKAVCCEYQKASIQIKATSS